LIIRKRLTRSEATTLAGVIAGAYQRNSRVLLLLPATFSKAIDA
jgi:hypothetical protein